MRYFSYLKKALLLGECLAKSSAKVAPDAKKRIAEVAETERKTANQVERLV